MKKLIPLTILAATIFTSSAMAEEVEKVSKFFAEDGILTTEANYPIHETSRQMLLKQELVGVNNFKHDRVLTPTDNQPVVRMNRDTYYSVVIVDVSEGATITLPEIPEGAYMSMQVISEDHRPQPMKYGSGTYYLSTHTGSHVYIIVRTDATLPLEQVHAIQDGMSVDAKSAKAFKAEQVNKASFYETELNLKKQAPALMKEDPTRFTYGMFTSPEDASKELFVQKKYEVGTALGWGGAQIDDNIYELTKQFDKKKCYQATFEDPQDLAFWSFTVYDATGRMFNDLANINGDVAEQNKDGTYTISLGCGEEAPNNLPIAEGNKTDTFNIVIRHYMPSNAVIKGLRLEPLVKEVK
ncbi:DUF1254 domain-containing protein [Motilimonas pumila]|uniref:DUF1254 domain-containing protein n=1 Tax=Motilimonas pumila TaxID=2303987 RepID=A0A418YC90_9GAMM|nr:DUF1254 domain-containing protein [Motilimonas pumila]RJG42134.1 DUF1254 domain-containing protein [Motilimonas pumila]